MTVESPLPQGICGVVLAGAYPKGSALFDRLRPRPLLPVAHEPLVLYPMRWLARAGVSNVAVCVNGPARSVRAAADQASGLRLNTEYVEDWMPRGAAGCVRDAAQLLQGDVLVVVDGTSIPRLDLRALLDTHRSRGAALTIAVDEDPGPDGSRPGLRPAGVYAFERRALGYIGSAGFQDIKETLIPQLHRAGEYVAVYECGSTSPRVVNAETYLSVSRWAISRLGREVEEFEEYERRGEALVARSAAVAQDVLFVGPVIVGPHAQLHEGATIVGPSAVGAGCRVGPRAVVARSVLWNQCRVGANSTLDRCVLGDHATIAPGAALYNSLKAGSLPLTPSRNRAAQPSSLPAAWIDRLLSVPPSQPAKHTNA